MTDNGREVQRRLDGVAPSTGTRLERGRPLSEQEIARREAEDRARLRDAPVLIGYSGPKPAEGMQFEVQRWDSVTQGWSHEAYARTDAAAKELGRQRLGVFGQRWRVRGLVRSGGGSPQARRRRSGGTTVTGYDASKPQPRSGPKEDPDRTETEKAMAAEIARICESRGTVKPKGLGQMREPELRAALERLGGQMP